MAQVTVTINRRPYRMSCEEGEQPHLLELAADLDGRIGDLRGRFGEIGDTRLTVMAALAMADELAEAKKKLQSLEPQLAALEHATLASADGAQSRQVEVAN